jgi:hypothetical protein
MTKKTEAKPKELLSDVLRRQFHRNALAISAVADTLGENRTSVYTWLDRNTFPRDTVVRLAQVAGLEPHDIGHLEARFAFTSSMPRERRSTSATSSAESETALYRGSVGGDVVVRITCVEPPEWHPSFWASADHRELIDAVGRGVHLAYVIPEDREYTRWSDESAVQMLPGVGDIEQAFARFARTVLTELRDAKDQLGLVRSAAAPFYLPFATITLHLRPAADASSDAPLSAIKAVLECQSQLDAVRVTRTRVALPLRFAQQVARFIRSAASQGSAATPYAATIIRVIDAVLDDGRARVRRS